MLFALAALLLQPQAATQMAYSAENTALIQPADYSLASSSPLPEISLPLTPISSGISIQPAPDSESEELPNAPEPSPAPVSGPRAIDFLISGKPMTVSVGQLLDEEHHKQRIWMGLGIAAHSAATFDAWSTRHAITTDGTREVKPLLKPFAGNSSIYAAIQVGPVVMDYVGKKMMYSRHSWARH